MALYIENQERLKILNQKMFLPKGSPTGYGNLIFLFSRTFDQSVSMINNQTIDNNNKYYYYYYNRRYRGMLNSRTYNINHIDIQKDLYGQINDRTSLQPHPVIPIDRNNGRNMYFDMEEYLSIFYRLTQKLSPVKKIFTFCKYLKEIVNRPDLKKYNKMMLVDVEQFSKTAISTKTITENFPYFIYYTLYKYPEVIDELDIDIILYVNPKHSLIINPSKCSKKETRLFKTLLNRLYSYTSAHIDIEAIDDVNMDKEIQKEIVTKTIMQKYNFIGDDDSEVTELDDEESNMPSQIEEEISAKVDKVVDDIDEITDVPPDNETIENRVVDEINEDEETIRKIYDYNKLNMKSKSQASTARDALLREQQKEVTINNIKLKDINKVSGCKTAIKTTNVANAVKTSNPNMKNVKFANFEKNYNETHMQRDIINNFTALNNKSIPMYVRKLEVEDTSDELNYKETWKVYLEDENRQRHVITVDIPKFVEDKFLYLGGNKKIIIKQNFMYPVVKHAPDTVQIVTNVNKMFITRIGTRSLGTIEKFKKLIQQNQDVAKQCTFGNAAIVNVNYVSTIEYDELSRIIVEFKNKNCDIIFNQKKALEQAEKENIKIPSGKMYIGKVNNEPVFIDIHTQKTDTGEGIIQLMISTLTEEQQDEYITIKAGKRLMYNSAKTMAQAVPLITLFGLWEGLTTTLKKMKVKYRLTEKFPKDLKINESYIAFKDCFLVYEDTIEAALLLNGIHNMPCGSYTMADMDTNEPYVEFFGNVYGKKSIIYALFNQYEFMIDEITREILHDINLPDDFVELCIYASNLLADNAYTKENKQYIYRVRSNEVVPAILSTVIANNYTTFRNSGGKKKLSIPRDAVIKELLTLQTVEDYSTLNPIVELEKSRTLTAKGWRGTNLERSYTIEKRSFDNTMLGVSAMSTSPDGNCGIMRTMPLEPTITNARGYAELNYDNLDKLKDVNLFSAGELLTTNGARHDDSSRTAMALKQSKHVIPIKKAMPVLISNGADEAVRYSLSSDFCVNAEEDGQVLEINPETEVMIVKYKSGKIRAINLQNHIVKNGAGGFYLNNKLITDLKEGDKFKANDCLAWHNKFFNKNNSTGTCLNMGALEKVAIMSTYNNYQDGCFITKKLSDDTAADLLFQESGVIGKNATIDYLMNVGDKVDTGDIICSYDTSYETPELNKFLDSLSSELKDEVNETSKQVIKAHHSGIIEDIKIYSTVDLEDMSPSLRKYVSKYYKKVKSVRDQINKYDSSKSVYKCGMLLNEPVGKVEPNKYGVLKGHKIEDGILIEVYIRHTDYMAIGDKMAFFTALKSIVSEVVEEGYEPYSEFRPEEEISATLAPSAILKRMTPSVITSGFGNKILVELKRSLFDLYTS